MKLGAEPKKIAILGGLLLVAIVVFFMNSSPSVETVNTPAAQSAAPALPAGSEQTATTSSGRQRGRGSGAQFSPSVRPKRGEKPRDPMTIDPTLRLDLLAKLQSVSVGGSRRSIFDFSQPPAPKPEPVKVAKPVPNPIVPVKPPDAEVEAAKAAPPKPQAPPIPLKFYGYIAPTAANTASAPRRAFFVEGEDIFVAHEGEVVKKRYKIVKIGVNSVVVEDTQFGSQQTLPLEAQQG